MSPICAKSKGFYIEKINVETLKTDRSILEIHEIFLVVFSLIHKLRQGQFFIETFLVAETSIKMILEMFFPLFNNVNV